ncbi:hypothetical protein LEMLEM_LOCUS17902 [Lemmus lemmus]
MHWNENGGTASKTAFSQYAGLGAITPRREGIPGPNLRQGYRVYPVHAKEKPHAPARH